MTEDDEREHEGWAGPDVRGAVARAIAVARGVGVDLVRRYHRLDVDGCLEEPDEPVLFVANHGFGGLFDLNVFAMFAAFADMGLERELTLLTHQIAWTLRVGPFLEPLGARPASHESATEAFAAGHHVLVMPGGDLDAHKSFADRDRILFSGRSGFARLAMEAGVPIVPIVSAGAGETLLVLSDGQRLARLLRLDTAFRQKTFPVTVSVPWGLNVGAAGFLPYLPLPTKLATRVLPPMRAAPGESAEDFAGRVQAAMQETLTELADSRRPWSR